MEGGGGGWGGCGVMGGSGHHTEIRVTPAILASFPNHVWERDYGYPNTLLQ